MDKNEILANMYVLRAGLSFVAVNAKHIRGTINTAKSKAKKDEKAARDKLKNAQDDLANNRALLAESYAGEENRKKAGKEQSKENDRLAQNFADDIVKGVFKTILLLIGAVACAYVSLIGSIMQGWLGEPPHSEFIRKIYGWMLGSLWTGEGSLAMGLLISIITWVMICVGAVAAVGCLALLGMALIGHPFWGTRFRRDKRTKGMKSVKQYKADIKLYSQAVENASAIIPLYENDLKAVQNNGKKEVANACASLQPLAANTAAFYKALRATFSTFLDERDWDNLDLLTYYIETGRADTVKESLQLLDRQKQTDQIVRAVNEAAGAVCRTVNNGLRVLQNDMRRCFNVLSEQIESVGSAVSSMNGRISSVESTIASQNAQLSSLASEVNLSKALNSQRNESSSQLITYAKECASDTKYIADQIRWAQIGGR